jgi:hypothetical protein
MADKTDPSSIDVLGALRALGTEYQPMVEAWLQDLSTAFAPKENDTPPSGPAETRSTSTPHEAQRSETSRPAAIPYPFANLPGSDEALTDLRLADTLGPLLAQIAGLTQVLAVASLGEVPPARLHEVMELVAAHSAAAHTLFTRWVAERQGEG